MKDQDTYYISNSPKWVMFLLGSLFAIASVFAVEEAPPAEVMDKINSAIEAEQLESSTALPPGTATFEARLSEEVDEYTADVLVPVWLVPGEKSSGMLFVNPRSSWFDEGQYEMNLGVGYRQLMPEQKLITGINAFYDNRQTRNKNWYDQFGVGFEMLSEWVDARFNAYWPENKRFMIDEETVVTKERRSSTSAGTPAPEGHAIVQTLTTRTKTTTTTETFQQFEEAMDGYDFEVGAKIAGLPHWLETRVFVGYYHYDEIKDAIDPDGAIEGAKARVEIRTVPLLILDAAVFEDDRLNGSDYFLGGRIQLPLDLAKISQARNPFSLPPQSPEQTDRAFANRLTEMVIRDPHVRIGETEFVENESMETVAVQSSTQKRELELVSQANFVDKDRAGSTQDGTWENPYDTIIEGVENRFGIGNVYVVASGISPYEENINVTGGLPDLHLIGSGVKVMGLEDKSFGGNTPTVVNGGAMRPYTFRFEGNSTLRDVSVAGFTIQNQSTGNVKLRDSGGLGQSGVVVRNVQSFRFYKNTVEAAQAGLVIGSRGAKTTSQIYNNTFNGLPVAISANVFRAPPGSGVSEATTMIHNNTFTGNSLGVLATADGGNTHHVDIRGNQMDGIGNPYSSYEFLTRRPFNVNKRLVPDMYDTPMGVALSATGGGKVKGEVADNLIENMRFGVWQRVSSDGGGRSLAPTVESTIDADVTGNTIVAYVKPYLPEGLVSVKDAGGSSGDTAIHLEADGYGAKIKSDVRNNLLENYRRGIKLEASSGGLIKNTVAGNQVNGNRSAGVDTECGIALKAEYSGQVKSTVSGNTVNEYRRGIRMYDYDSNSVYAKITGNTLNDNRVGINAYTYDGYVHATISDNMIVGSEPQVMEPGIMKSSKEQRAETGIELEAYGQVGEIDSKVTGNTIVNYNRGIEIQAENGGTINNTTKGNTITGPGVTTLESDAAGVYVEAEYGGVSAKIEENTITQNRVGVELYTDGGNRAVRAGSVNGFDVQVKNNTLEDNLLGVLAHGSEEAEFERLEIEGNTVKGGGLEPMLKDYGIEGHDFGFAGVVVVAPDSGEVPSLSVKGNTVSDHVVGVALVAPGNSKMNDAQVKGNTLKDNFAGVLVLSLQERARINQLTVKDNVITGAGLQTAADLVGQVWEDFASWVPVEEVPQVGLAGITLLAVDYGEIKESVVKGNTVSGHLTGVNLLSYNGDMIRSEVSKNTLSKNIMGISAIGWGKASEMRELQIENNNVDGADSGLAWGVELVTGQSYPNVGASGILVAQLEDARGKGTQIKGNTVNNYTVGIAALAYSGGDLNSGVVKKNTVTGAYVGFHAVNDDAKMKDAVVEKNHADQNGVEYNQDPSDWSILDFLEIPNNPMPYHVDGNFPGATLNKNTSANYTF